MLSRGERRESRDIIQTGKLGSDQNDHAVGLRVIKMIGEEREKVMKLTEVGTRLLGVEARV